MTPMPWNLLAPRVTAALETADYDAQQLLETRLESLFTPWLDGRIDAREFARRLGITDAVHAERDPAFRAEQRELTAYHEAGHAVTAHVLGCRVTHVTIEPGEHDLSYGHVRYHPPVGQSLEDDCLITLAGPIAQAMGGFVGSMERHRVECNSRLLDGRPGMSDAVRLAHLRYLEIRAGEIVLAHWPTITDVTRALLSAGALEREAFLATVTPVAPVALNLVEDAA